MGCMDEREDKRSTPSKRKPAQRSSAGGAQRSGTSLGTTRMQPSKDAQRRSPSASSRRASSASSRSAAASRSGGPRRSAPARRSASADSSRRSASRERRTELSRDVRKSLADPRKPAAAIDGEAVASGGFFSGKRRIAIVAVVAAIALIVLISLASSFCQADNNKIKACEQWRSTVRQACMDCKLDEQWTDSILALMAVESGGDVDVESVTGAQHDIMQAAEGKYGKYVLKGSKKYDVQANTPEASIYAGVKEFKYNYDLWKKYLNGIGPSETGEIQLVIQGYNFGGKGWYKWCKKNNVTTYTVEKAQEYSDTQMPEEAKGTPNHAEKWFKYYELIRG